MSINSSQLAPIAELVGQYDKDRGVTILEIGIDQCKYGLSLSKKFNATCVMLYLGRLHDEKQFDYGKKYPGMVVLNPMGFGLQELQTLARCEHFDVVIIHGIPHKLKNGHDLKLQLPSTLDMLLQLGDHTFIEAAQEVVPIIRGKKGHEVASGLYYIQTPKKGLDIARWNCSHMPWQQGIYRYPIISTFKEKHYQKKESAETPIPWLKGINLSTFVMLRGICPSEKNIIDTLNSMRTIQHNDLIIGNMIVQGSKVLAIDLDDPRWNGSVTKCITAALTVFDESYNRLKEPANVLRRYRMYLEELNKRHGS